MCARVWLAVLRLGAGCVFSSGVEWSGFGVRTMRGEERVWVARVEHGTRGDKI